VLEEHKDTSIPKIQDNSTSHISLLCTILIMHSSNEELLVKEAHSLRTGIFACDQFVVYSNASWTIAPDVETRNIGGSLHCPRGGDGYSALNTWIFMRFWKKVIDDGDYRHKDWTIKTDADAVFFPGRLRVVLQDHKSSHWVNNCHHGMHGPLEVLSREAMTRLAQDYMAAPDKSTPHSCYTSLPFEEWGEDMFLDQCLKTVYKLPGDLDERLICEADCNCDDYFWCQNDAARVAFHPFKEVSMYKQCIANAMATPGSAPI
jgi:hypothetical protein